MSHAAAPDHDFPVVRRFILRPHFSIGGSQRARVGLAVLAALLSSLSASAQELSASPTAPGESRWGLGLGVGSIQKPYRGVGRESVVVPILLYENRWVSVAGPVADLKLPSPNSAISFRLRARYDPGAGYEAGDSIALTGMEERKTGTWLGGALLWRTDLVDVGAEWLGDASGNSKGQRATFSLQRRFPVGSFAFTPRVEAIWLDRKNVNYYYGVRAQEASAGRSAYEADSTVNARFGVRVDYRIAPRHAVFLDLSTTRLGSEIKNSPIVERSSASSAFVGYSYQF